MLTAEQIKAMDDTEAQLHFAACCGELYGPQWKTAFARDVDTDQRTIHRWMEDGARPPVWALRLAEMTAHARQISGALVALDDALKNLSEMRDTL